MFYWGDGSKFTSLIKDNWRQVALQISGHLPLNYTFQCDRRREVITIWILFELAAQLPSPEYWKYFWVNIGVRVLRYNAFIFASVESRSVPPEIPWSEDPWWLLRTILEQRLTMDSLRCILCWEYKGISCLPSVRERSWRAAIWNLKTIRNWLKPRVVALGKSCLNGEWLCFYSLVYSEYSLP